MKFKRKVALEIELNEAGRTTRRFRIENLRFTFSIQKQFTTTTNICDVQIYNLSEQTRNLFHDIGDQMTLYTGYESDDSSQVLFIADITRVYHQTNTPDIITHLEGLDADLTFANKTVKVSFEGNVEIRTVLLHIANFLGLTKVVVPQNLPSTVYINGFSCMTAAREALNMVTGALNLEWSIQNKELIVTEKQKSTELPPILVSPDTGLIYYPEILKDRYHLLSEKRIIGWRVRTLLNPQITPKRKIQLYSPKNPRMNGIYFADTVRHVGDTHGQAWETQLDLLPI